MYSGRPDCVWGRLATMWRLPATLLVVVTLLIDGTYQVRAAAFDDDADDDSHNQVRSSTWVVFLSSLFLTALSSSFFHGVSARICYQARVLLVYRMILV